MLNEYKKRLMAGDKGVEPLQTRSQSPARYHYANPQYLLRENGVFTRHLIYCTTNCTIFQKGGKIGLEPITHRMCNCCMCLYLSI